MKGNFDMKNIIETVKTFMEENPTIFYAVIGVIVFAILLIIILSSKKGKKKTFEPQVEEAKIESKPKEEKTIYNTSGVSIFEAINNQTNATQTVQEKPKVETPIQTQTQTPTVQAQTNTNNQRTEVPTPPVNTMQTIQTEQTVDGDGSIVNGDQYNDQSQNNAGGED